MKAKKLVALVLAAVMMMSLAVCGASAEGAVKDTFTVALGGEPEMLDPSIATDSVSETPIQMIYLPLFTMDGNGDLVNGACESYTVSEDGLTYTLKLVDGNKWSDGVDVKASDYAFAAKRSLGMGSALSYYSYFIKDYVLNADKYEGADVADMTDIGIVADDEANTVTFTLAKPCTYYTRLLASNVFTAVRADVATEHESTWALNADMPVNGAYKPVSLQMNSELTFVKNDSFVFADKVKTQNIVLKVMEDMDAQLMAFQTGEVDLALSVDASVATKLYAGSPELIETNSVINYYVQMNSADWSTAQALTDYNVRRALQLALDRDQICEALDSGDAYYALYGYVPKGIAGVDGDFRTEADEAHPLVSYDPEQAKALLAESGWTDTDGDGFVDKDGQPLTLVYKYNANNMHNTVAQVMQEQWKAVGIKVTFETEEVKVFFADRDENGNYELARGAMTADYMDPTTFLCMLISSAQQKPVVTDETYDGMIADAEACLDAKERLQKLHDAETYLVETKAYTIPVFGYKTLYLCNPNMSGIGFDPVSHTYLSYAYVAQ